MLLLDNPIQDYAWGSRTQLATLLGNPPSAEPQAELWIGAHPRAPSRLSDGRSLRDAIHADPDGMLGPEVRRRFGGELPFLLKVLAVEAPLSLQAHPNAEQARAGFEREQRAGVPLSAPERTYKDPNHKPELLCALTPFRALSGFRPREEAAELFAALRLSDADIARTLRAEGAGLRSVFVRLMTLPRAEQVDISREVIESCRRVLDAGGPFPHSLACALELWERYPSDIGVVASLLLNHVTLQPLEALFLGAGSLHAYLGGTGVELMANSDNVLRGGLTPKHIDVPELLHILRFESDEVRLTPTRTVAGEVIYETPAPDFRLSRIDLDPDRDVRTGSAGPELLLCVRGQARLELFSESRAPAVRLPPRSLKQGQACFIPASCTSYRLMGSARLFKATVS